MELCIVRFAFYTTNEMQTCTMFFIIISALPVSGGISAYHQDFQNFMCIHTSGRQQESMTIPKASHTFLQAPDDGRKNRPKHVE